MQRTPAVALGERRVGCAGAGAGALDIEHRQRIDSAAQTAPQARDPAQVEIEQLQRRNLLASDLSRQFVRRQKYLFSHRFTPLARTTPALPQVLPIAGLAQPRDCPEIAAMRHHG